MPTRVEAVQLMERANGVIRPSHIMPNRKLQATFRAYGLDGSVKAGTFEAVYTVDSERYETIFVTITPFLFIFPTESCKTITRRRPRKLLNLRA
jgi:hypothetical protein